MGSLRHKSSAALMAPFIPNKSSVNKIFAPNAFINLRRSMDTLSGMVRMHSYPRAAGRRELLERKGQPGDAHHLDICGIVLGVPAHDFDTATEPEPNADVVHSPKFRQCQLKMGIWEGRGTCIGTANVRAGSRRTSNLAYPR